MEPARIWRKDAKLIELDVQDGSLGASLIDRGFARFLGVSRSDGRIASIAAEHPALSGRLTRSADPKVVKYNNADVLILSGTTTWQLWRYGRWRHAEHVAWPLRPRVCTLWAAIVGLAYLLLGRVRWAGIVPCRTGAGATRYVVVLKVRRPKRRKSARYYVPHALGIRGFLERLSEERIRHVVLRWFESLPDLPPGEDLDLLVDDDDLEPIRAIFDEGPGVQPCDVYTVTGLPGSDYRKMPYFPPRVSEAILAGARPHQGICRVPSAEHHFLSLAYHAVYHKGQRSGLASTEGKTGPNLRPEHDYASVLGALARKLGMDVRITREDLDEHLEAKGWRPPRDMLARLGPRDRWIRRLVRQTACGPEDRGLGVFILRAEGLNRGGLASLVAMLEHYGFEIVTTKILTPRESSFAASSVRGGNWGRGPFRASGGPPAAAVVTYDTEPLPMSFGRKRRFPEMTNARLLAKRNIRDAFNRDHPDREPCNVLHSSDNGHEALDYIQILMPELLGEIQTKTRQIRQAYHTGQPVFKTLTRLGRRAKVELVEHDGHLAVVKTFKPYQARYCRREADAMRRLSRTIPEIPPVLASDRYRVVYPYYDDVLQYRRNSGKLFPLGVAKQAIGVLREVYEAGFALIDAHVENVLIDRAEGLKLIDFEFCYRYPRKPASFEECYDVAGCPADFDGDLPHGGAMSYATGWQPFVGLSLRSLLHDPPWLQHAKRFGYYLAHLPRLLPKRIRHYYRGSRRAFRSFLCRVGVSRPEEPDLKRMDLEGAAPKPTVQAPQELGPSAVLSERERHEPGRDGDSRTEQEGGLPRAA
ncbi:MAG TPA: hypothetical protein VMY37_36765 [Thermoguttaceae bacterium]|nr:hypothetical protein [Thermoguttaceae bacterium]